MASLLVIDFPVASIQESIAASSRWCQRSPICKPRPVLGGRPKRFSSVGFGLPLPSHFAHLAGKTRFVEVLDCLPGAKPVPLQAVHSVSGMGDFSRNFLKLVRPAGQMNPANSAIFKSRMKVFPSCPLSKRNPRARSMGGARESGHHRGPCRQAKLKLHGGKIGNPFRIANPRERFAGKKNPLRGPAVGAGKSIARAQSVTKTP
jgi:hypothetical protein